MKASPVVYSIRTENGGYSRVEVGQIDEQKNEHHVMLLLFYVSYD